MDDTNCSCRGCNGQPDGGRWLESIDDPLPADLATVLTRFNTEGMVRTLDDWISVIGRERGAALPVDDLCHVPGPSPHHGFVEEQRYDFACCVDAVILAAIVDNRVDIHTMSPDGTAISIDATSDGAVTASPLDTVFSFGADPTVSVGDPPVPGDAYRAICPWVHAFPDIKAYHAWDDSHEIPTVAFAPVTATVLARRLAGRD